MSPSRTPGRLPTRSNSTLKSGPPADAAKSDDDAVEDVYRELSSTGSLIAAAKKLEQYALTESETSTPRSDDKPVPAPVPVPPTAAAKRPIWADDPEEAEYINNQQVDDDAIMSSEEDYEDDDDDESGQVVHLQEVVEGLWIGDLVAAMDTEGLEQRGITNILSLLRPALAFSPQFSVYPLEIDDSADTDILTHLPSCVSWIQQALTLRSRTLDPIDESPSEELHLPAKAAQPSAGGVLVHCQAGMSRSATVCAAFLMRTLDLDPVDAVTLLKEKRPVVEPSDTFWYQLGLFYNADGRVSLKDRSTRQFYMERTTSQFMNGDGGAPPLDKMAKYPATPTPSNPPTPLGGHGRRKIRCKMCRRHLAVREHMMDHILDQAPVSRPRTPSNFALPSPLQSTIPGFTSRRPSVVSDVINPLTGLPGATARSRGASMSSSGVPSPGPHERDSSKESNVSSLGSGLEKPLSPAAPVPLPRTTTPGLVLTSSTPEVPTQGKLAGNNDLLSGGKSLPTRITSSPEPLSANSNGRVFQNPDQLASRLPPHLLALRTAGFGSNSLHSSPFTSSPNSPEREFTSTMPQAPAPGGGGSGERGVSRRMSLLAMTPAEGKERRSSASASGSGSGSGDHSALAAAAANAGPPILVNPKCSGYFVEPLTWMEPVLKSGAVAGKLICPNEKCNAKIGNFDWAGVQCGCKEWVTPGFCISRSKVDEVW